MTKFFENYILCASDIPVTNILGKHRLQLQMTIWFVKLNANVTFNTDRISALQNSYKKSVPIILQLCIKNIYELRICVYCNTCDSQIC